MPHVATIDKPYGRLLTCKRCGEQWRAHMEGRDPILCAKCGSPYWNLDDHLMPKPRKRRRA